MRDGPDGRCPTEAYDDRESACRVMLGIFDSQEDCARFHGCPERRCAIERRWRNSGRRDQNDSSHGAGFVGVAFDGPGNPSGGNFRSR